MSAWVRRPILLTLVLLGMFCLPAGYGQEQALQRESHTPEQRLRFAEGLLARQFYDMAEGELRYFMDHHGDHEKAPVALFRLIQCLRAQNKSAETMSAINQFQARWADHDLAPKLFLWKGELLLQNAKYQQAEACFRGLMLSADTQIQEAAVYFMAQSYARTDRAELAIKTYGRIAVKEFDQVHLYRPYAVFAIALAAQQAGDYADGEAGFLRLKNASQIPASLREESIFRLGENYFAQGKHQKAIEQYELLLVEYPKGFFSCDARKRRAWAYLQEKEYGRAEALTRDWQARYPDCFDYEVEYIRGAALLGGGFWEKALDPFRKLATSADVPDGYRQLARTHEIYCLLRLSRHEDAVEAAGRFVADYPKHGSLADVRYFAAESLYQLQRYEAAAAEYRRALGSFVGDWRHFTDASLRLAEALERQGKGEEASQVYRELAVNPRAENPAYMLLQAGKLERDAGRRAAAVADFERVLQEFPQAADECRAATIHLGELYAAGEDYAKAERLVEQLLLKKGQTGRGRLLFFLGYLHFKQKHYELAERYLRQVLETAEVGPVRTDAKFFLTGALLEQKREDEAMAVFADLLALAVDERPKLSASLLFRLEQLYSLRGRYQVSESICRWILQWSDPDIVYRGSLRLAQILIAMHRLTEARDLLEALFVRCEEAGPGQGEMAFSLEEISSLLGEVFLHSGANDRAVSAFERTLARPGVGMEYAVRARWGLAQVLAREGRHRQALHYAVNAFVLGNDPVYTPQAMYMAIDLLVKQARSEEAKTTWKELQVRYPSYAEQKRNDSLIRSLTDAPQEGVGG